MDGINKMETHKNFKDKNQLNKEFRYSHLHSKSGNSWGYK